MGQEGGRWPGAQRRRGEVQVQLSYTRLSAGVGESGHITRLIQVSHHQTNSDVPNLVPQLEMYICETPYTYVLTPIG